MCLYSYMKSILIQNYPLPPSENQIYRNVPRVGRVATQELKDYKRSCAFWGMANKQYKQIFWELAQEYPNHVLKVDAYIVLKHERIWTKDGRPKKLDASNRLKALHDQLAEYLGIDDKAFFNVSAEKISGEQECAVLLISWVRPMNVVELLNTFKDTAESEPESIQ